MVRRTIVFRCLLVACVVLPSVHILWRRHTHLLSDLDQIPWDGLTSLVVPLRRASWLEQIGLRIFKELAWFQRLNPILT